MNDSDSLKKPPASIPDVMDILQSNHALGQIAAATRGLEIALEQQSEREQALTSENEYLRSSGKRLAEELTGMILKLSELEEATSLGTQRLSEVEWEAGQLREEILRKDSIYSLNEERQRTFFAAEVSARENRIRDEITQVTKLAALESRIEHEKITIALAEKTSEFDLSQKKQEAEFVRLRQENVQLAEMLEAARHTVNKMSVDHATFEENARKKLSELEINSSETALALRGAQKENSALSEKLDRERAAARANQTELLGVRQASDLQIERAREDAQNEVRQARHEFEIRLKQAGFEAQSGIETLRAETSSEIESLVAEAHARAEELQSERKRRKVAEDARQEAETERESALRDSGARVRRIEDECASLAAELKKTLEMSEARIAALTLEMKNERIRASRESAETVADLKAREDEVRARAIELGTANEELRRELDAFKRQITRLRSPLENGVDQLRDTCDRLRLEREQIIRQASEDRTRTHAEISRLKAELVQRERLHREEARWEVETADENKIAEKINSSSKDLLRRKEKEIEKVRARVAQPSSLKTSS